MCKRSSNYKAVIFCHFLFMLLISSILSCKKETPLKNELVGEKVALVGKWNWIYSHHYYNFCDPGWQEEFLTPISESATFSCQIFSNGYVHNFRNDSMINEYRLTFDYFKHGNGYEDGYGINSEYRFNIYFDDSKFLNFSGGLNSDTLVATSLSSFLFRSEPGCENYLNYFIKE